MSEPGSLKDQFSKALQLQKSLSSGKLSPRSEEYSKTYNEAIRSFNSCRKIVDRIGLYSRNETADDISSNDIKYLAIDYHLATLFESAPPRPVSAASKTIDPVDRLKTIKSIVLCYCDFLTLLDSYKIIPESFSTKLHNALQNREKEQGLPDFKELQAKEPVDRRAEKIELFKLEKSLQQKISAFSQKTGGDDEESEYDDETYRQIQFAQLGIYAIKSLTAIQNYGLEVELLQNFPLDTSPSSLVETSSDSRTNMRGADGNDYTARLEQPISQQPLLSGKGKVNRPFTIVSSRDQIAKQAFGTGQRLPTMSVEEYLEEEIKRGGIIQGGGEQSQKEEDDGEDEDNNDKQDEATYKARAWDEFTEANPRGSGNTINRG